MSDDIKNLLEKQGRAFEEFKGALAAEEKARTTESEAKTAKLNDELTRLAKDIKSALDHAEAAESAAARPNRGDGTKSTPEEIAYKAGFFDYIRKGNENGLRDLEQKAMVTSSNADGGYTVRPDLDTMIDQVARAVTVMRSLATVRSINGRSLKKITTKSGAAIGGWGNETTAPTETGTPALVELELTPGTLWAEPRTTQEFLEDSDQNVEQWLADEVGIAFNEQEEAAFITSTTGTGVNRPRGFLLETPIANASYAWGSIGYIASGAAGAFATASSSVSPVDAFADLLHALKPVYRANGRWLMADATVATVRKFKDGSGNLQWRPGVTVSEPYVELFLGKPIEYSDSMPVVASNSYSVAFADWKRAYTIVDRLGTQIIRDALTAKPYVKFYTRRRVGGAVTNFEAIKLMKMATS
jgi:HK97 family phage major capsid protein